MNQRLAGDIQKLNDGGPENLSVELIRRKDAQLDPRAFEATWQASSNKPSAQEVNAMIQELMLKQQIPMGTQPGTAVYPYA